MSMRNELDVNQFLDTRRIGGTHILVVTLLILTMMVDGYDIFVVGTVAPYLAAAAVLVLVTISAVVMLKQPAALSPAASDARATPAALATPQVAPGEPAIAPIVSAGNPGPDRDPALSALSDQHFERSKLVVLGIATKDARQADWAYERQLAGTLLSDTRLYRVAAEERGMQSLAGVMRDLELVLLQTSMSEQRDAASLEHLQRLIRRRDLITKMEIVHASGR